MVNGLIISDPSPAKMLATRSHFFTLAQNQSAFGGLASLA